MPDEYLLGAKLGTVNMEMLQTESLKSFRFVLKVVPEPAMLSQDTPMDSSAPILTFCLFPACPSPRPSQDYTMHGG